MIIFFVVILSLALSAATYFLRAYTLMCMGRKAGLTLDWMPYVPVARTIYRLFIIREPWWKVFFNGGTSILCMLMLTGTWSLILGQPFMPSIPSLFAMFAFSSSLLDVITNLNLISIVPCFYTIAILFFTFQRHYKTLKVFGFNPYFALAAFVAPVASNIIYYIIAYSNIYTFVGLKGTIPPVKTDDEPPTKNQESVVTNVILCTAGAYKGGSFPIRDGEELVIGRDSTISQIVVTAAASKVSRRHCGIRYSAIDNRYIVTDYSSNGTYLENGTRLTSMTPTPLNRGTVLVIGNHENQFKLS